MKRQAFILLFFACFGVATEVIFVAITNLISNTPAFGSPKWSLMGYTYVWMIPIYMLIPIIGFPLMNKFRNFPLLARLLIYALSIFTIEFISGFLLEQITGKCPWEYTTGWNIMGYIQLEFLPAWMFFSFLLERLYYFLEEHLKN